MLCKSKTEIDDGNITGKKFEYLHGRPMSCYEMEPHFLDSSSHRLHKCMWEEEEDEELKKCSRGRNYSINHSAGRSGCSLQGRQHEGQLCTPSEGLHLVDFITLSWNELVGSGLYSNWASSYTIFFLDQRDPTTNTIYSLLPNKKWHRWLFA